MTTLRVAAHTDFRGQRAVRAFMAGDSRPGVPLRMVAGNWINCFALCRRHCGIMLSAKWRGMPLRWAKTDHVYPNRAALVTERRKLGEILTGGQWITRTELDVCAASKPVTQRLGEQLIAMGLITEDDLYAALALQNHLPVGMPETSSVSRAVTRSLPGAVARKWRCFRFELAAGELYMAGAELPSDDNAA